MHLQPNRNYISNDDVQTPLALARRIVAHFRPSGRILEPCAGNGNFLRALREHAARTETLLRAAGDCAEAQACTGRSRPLRRPPPGVHGARHSRCIFWCEIKRGRDFFAWRERVDWIVTNPPWSQFRSFLQHATRLADHVVFLVTVNHLWTKARLGDLAAAGFGLKEIALVETPRTFPPLGFQLGAVHLQRGWRGRIRLMPIARCEPHGADAASAFG